MYQRADLPGNTAEVMCPHADLLPEPVTRPCQRAHLPTGARFVAHPHVDHEGHDRLGRPQCVLMALIMYRQVHPRVDISFRRTRRTPLTLAHIAFALKTLKTTRGNIASKPFQADAPD